MFPCRALNFLKILKVLLLSLCLAPSVIIFYSPMAVKAETETVPAMWAVMNDLSDWK